MHARTVRTLPIAVACTAVGLTVALALGGHGPATSPVEVAEVRRAVARPIAPAPTLILEPAARCSQEATRREVVPRTEAWHMTQARALRLRALATRLPDVSGKTRRRRVVDEMAALTARLGADLDPATRAAVETRLAKLHEPRLAWRLRRSLELVASRSRRP